MKNKCFISTLSFIAALVIPCRAEFSMPWISPLSNRVEAMGGAALGIEDESTELNLLNAGNPAGLALMPKENRLNLNVGYLLDKSTKDTGETVKSRYETISPGMNNNGITCWIMKDLALSIQGQAQNLSFQYPIPGAANGQFGYFWYLGGLMTAYQFGEFSLGTEINYFQLKTTGEPSFSDFEKYEMQLKHVGWHTGLGYHKAIGDSDALDAGLAIGVDDRKPDFDSLDGTSPGAPTSNYDTIIDYITTVDMVGIDPVTGLPVLAEMSVNDKFEIKRTLFQVSGQFIYKFANTIQLGLVLNYENESAFEKTGTSFDPPISPFGQTDYKIGPTDYKSAEYKSFGLTPVIKGHWLLADNVIVKYGALYSNKGTYFQEDYSTWTSGEPCKSDSKNVYANNFALAIGCQSVDEAVAAACQFDQMRFKENMEFYNEDGQILYSRDDEYRQQAFRMGFEYRLVEDLQLRSGYAYLLEIFPSGNFNNLEKMSAHRFSFGVGLHITDALSCNLLGIYEIQSRTADVISTYVKTSGLIGLRQTF